MYCWICGKEETNYILLPEKDDDFQVPVRKNTYEIHHVDKFVFLYYVVCNHCMTMYLDYYPFDFKKIMKREIMS
jgi:hypothetical protein